MHRATLLFLAALVAGCTPTRTVTIEGQAPTPSVVAISDTVFIASPPDTVFLPGPETIVTETVPVEVLRYAEARPDTSRAFLLWHLSVDSARVELSGASDDLAFRRPQPGEALVCVAGGPSGLSCRVEGEPIPPPVQHIECPAPPACIIPGGLRGIVRLVVIVLLSAFVGRLLK